ncbi:MAG TPA: hypothetical protein VEV85_02000 [Bryobacteraceae bacterium]|nr:hypothetical protein [Bryobacteraceae bacterium]
MASSLTAQALRAPLDLLLLVACRGVAVQLVRLRRIRFVGADQEVAVLIAVTLVVV